jgi:PAS domain S-box-containing protein
MMGYTRDEYLRLFLPDTQPDLGVAQLRAAVAEVIAKGSASFPSRHRRKDGTAFDVHLDIRAIRLRGRDCLVAVWRDISLEKKASEALQSAADWHHALLQNTVEGICIFDETKAVLEVNDRFAEMLGYTPAEMVGMHPWDWDVTLSKADLDTRFPSSLLTRYTVETRHRRKDGTIYEVEVSIQHACIGGRNVAVTVARDISERKRAQQKLADSEQRLRLATSAARRAVWEYDFATGRLYWSPELHALFDMPPVEPSRALLESIMHEADRGVTDAAMQKAITEHGHYFAQYLVVIGDEMKWVEDRGAIQYSPDGHPERVIGLAQDITERKRNEQRLQESEGNLRTFFDTITDFLFVLDDTGKIQRINRTVVDRLGYPEEELLGLSVLHVHPAEQHAEAMRIVAAMLAGQADFCPVPLLAADGRLIPVETRVVAGLWQGKPALFGVSRDVSERRQAESRMRDQLDELRRWQEVMLDREDRILALKQEVNELLARLGEASRYSNQASGFEKP